MFFFFLNNIFCYLFAEKRCTLFVWNLNNFFDSSFYVYNLKIFLFTFAYGSGIYGVSTKPIEIEFLFFNLFSFPPYVNTISSVLCSTLKKYKFGRSKMEIQKI